MNFIMTKQMIIDELHEITDDERAIEYAISKLDFDGLINMQKEANEHLIKYGGLEKMKSFDENSPEYLIIKSSHQSHEECVLRKRCKFYSECLPGCKNIYIDFENWKEIKFDKIKEKYAHCLEDAVKALYN